MYEIMPLSRRSYNPFALFDELEKSLINQGGSSAISFKTDIKDTGDGIELKADLPGFNKEDIDVSIDGDILSIKAVRKSENDEKDDDGNYIRRERSFGSYSRSFDVSNIDIENINAKYENGVLTLDMPKHVEEKPQVRKLSIN